MNVRVPIGFILAFVIGVVCRLAELPLPAPPAIIGASLVVAMTTGFILVDRFMSHRPHTQLHICGGPTGDAVSTSSGDARSVS